MDIRKRNTHTFKTEIYYLLLFFNTLNIMFQANY